MALLFPRKSIMRKGKRGPLTAGMRNQRLVMEFFIIGLLAVLVDGENTCQQLNWCSGHGKCNSLTNVCACFNGWGSATDIPGVPMTKGDCSERMCKMGKAWMQIPSSATTAHEEVECSGAGLCNRASGICTCFKGYEGDACHRSTCAESGCSVHGRCVTLREASLDEAAQPSSEVVVGGYGGNDASTTWDADMIRMCLCDSSWPVGLGSGETQLAEWFAPDCTFRHCPSADNPQTSADETDCSGKLQDPNLFTVVANANGGRVGNKCHHECGGNGKCDHSTGLCDCYNGFSGEACNELDVLAVYGG